MGKVHYESVLSGDPACREYIQKGVERGIERRIIDSWKRCNQAGLNPFERNYSPQINSVRFRDRIEQSLEIVELFQFYMRRFSGMLERLGACSFVCDIDGYILSRVGYGKALQFFDNVSLFEGSTISEDVVGTNAPGSPSSPGSR
ncbi:MAG TPA: hypothetical protein VN450_06670 [Candidatus Methylomirabilis sp.]|nr:hypothetical protein [Candidatus Methylomirabilis sp.]